MLERGLDGHRRLFPGQATDALAFTSNGEFFDVNLWDVNSHGLHGSALWERGDAPSLDSNHFSSGESARWAECKKVALPRRRTRGEMVAVYKDFQERFYNSTEQMHQNYSKKRSHLNAYLQHVFGHRHGVWDYLETGKLPLHERILNDEPPWRKRSRLI
mgnify:CR=1 FL=1|jgi:hypothetical protein|tara:strand:- start:32 stop:508 length:477 start_codon:yes stop_codon:yes gene_type:complete